MHITSWVIYFLHIQSCHLPIHRPNKGMHQKKNVLHAWNKIARNAGTLLVYTDEPKHYDHLPNMLLVLRVPPKQRQPAEVWTLQDP